MAPESEPQIACQHKSIFGYLYVPKHPGGMFS